MKKNLHLFEILIPTHFNNGPLILDEHHNKFYKEILDYSGGLTLSQPLIGYWDNSGSLEKETTFFLRFTSTDKQAEKIAKLAKIHYKQQAIMYYKLSDKVTFV